MRPLFDTCKPHLENDLRYEQLASNPENDEINVKRNTAWKAIKHDERRMWDMIDSKGKADIKKETLIHESEIFPYFKNIFQSKKT